MFAYNSCPPDPEVVGERWREMWQQRLNGSGLWLEEWLRHQHRDAYWQHGSICENYSDITCPVLAVSGWADSYTNSVFRLLAQLDGQRKGLIGPHKYLHLGQPGPGVGFLQNSSGSDHWPCDVDNDVMAGPMPRIWMQESVPPSTAYDERSGRWVGASVVRGEASPDYPAVQSSTRMESRRKRACSIRTSTGDRAVRSPSRSAASWVGRAGADDLHPRVGHDAADGYGRRLDG